MTLQKQNLAITIKQNNFFNRSLILFRNFNFNSYYLNSQCNRKNDLNFKYEINVVENVRNNIIHNVFRKYHFIDK